MARVDELESAAHLIAGRIPAIQRIARDCRTYYTGLVSEETVIHWALQFRTPELVESALRLLDAVNFIDASKLAELLGRAFGEIPAASRDTSIIASIGKAYDSGPTVAYTFAKALGWDEATLAARFRSFGPELLEEAVRTRREVVLLDDNVTSGTQLERLISEMFPDYKGEREHLSEALPDELLRGLQAVPIHFVVAAELHDGRKRVFDAAKERNLNVDLWSGYRDFGNYLQFGGPLWGSRQESERVIQAVSDVARQLYKDKQWDEETLAGRLLGYGNLQKLVVFSHNVPKSLLPVFWKFGAYEGSDWFPLFPERREWGAYEKRIRDASPELRAIARLVATGAFGAALPALTVAVSIDGDPAESVVAFVPDEQSVGRAVEAHAKKLPNAPGKMQAPEHGAIYGPSEQQVMKYNARLDRYADVQVPEYLDALRASIRSNSYWIPVPLRIYNDGSRGASGVELELEIPDGVRWSAVAPVADPEPPKVPERPSHGLDLAALAARVEPISTHFDSLKETIRQASALGGEVRAYRDRGRHLIRIPFGTVIHGTFAERELVGLGFDAEGEFTIPFKVVCAEAPRAVAGALRIEIQKRDMPVSDVLAYRSRQS